MSEPITIIASVLSGGAMGAVIAHILTGRRDASNEKRILDRERRDRKHHFLGVLYRWRCQFQRSPHENILDHYRNTACDITYEAGVICPDFVDRAAFDALIAAVCSFTKADIEQPNHEAGREKVLHAISDIIRFAEVG